MTKEKLEQEKNQDSGSTELLDTLVEVLPQRAEINVSGKLHKLEDNCIYSLELKNHLMPQQILDLQKFLQTICEPRNIKVIIHEPKQSRMVKQ